jgi:hypothetical protein
MTVYFGNFSSVQPVRMQYTVHRILSETASLQMAKLFSSRGMLRYPCCYCKYSLLRLLLLSLKQNCCFVLSISEGKDLKTLSAE